jgi:predicted membrane channel-forming protein YqfA (hemolysin III family)
VFRHAESFICCAIGLLGTMFTLYSSSVYHQFSCCSQTHYTQLRRVDYLGIGVGIFSLTFGVFYPLFYQDEMMQGMTVVLVIIFQVINTLLIVGPCSGQKTVIRAFLVVALSLIAVLGIYGY